MTTCALPKEASQTPRHLPPRGHIDIWRFADATIAPWEIEALEALLPPQQRAAADRLYGRTLRQHYIVSHAMTLSVLGTYIDQPLRIVLDSGRYGKPHIVAPESARHIHFNVAHSGGMSVLAVTTGNHVGIDIERIRGDIAIDDIAPICFTGRELASLARLRGSDRAAGFFACWTRKEALLKAKGSGLAQPPAKVHVGLGCYDTQDGTPIDWSLRAFDGGPGYAGAVAIAGSEIETSVHGWHPRDAGNLRHCL